MRIFIVYFTLGLMIASTSQNLLFNYVKCELFGNCCDPAHVRFNSVQLESNLNKYLYGQPLVKKTLLNSLKAHFHLKNPKKPLVLSFHGPTGSGKNYVSRFVAESLFSQGVNSHYYKAFVSALDFPHNSKLNEYQGRIKEAIQDRQKNCHTNLFVFDEVDKAPVGLMDVVKPFIDFSPHINGIDYRKSVFIFLSNSATKNITLHAYQLIKQFIDRDSFQLKPFEDIIRNFVYYNKEIGDKGLFRSEIIDSHLIDFYIPFLPLERDHVKKCARNELLKCEFPHYSKEALDSDINEIADQMNYEPSGINLFSSTGCKRVPNLVRNLITQKNYFCHGEEL